MKTVSENKDIKLMSNEQSKKDRETARKHTKKKKNTSNHTILFFLCGQNNPHVYLQDMDIVSASAKITLLFLTYACKYVSPFPLPLYIVVSHCNIYIKIFIIASESWLISAQKYTFIIRVVPLSISKIFLLLQSKCVIGDLLVKKKRNLTICW